MKIEAAWGDDGPRFCAFATISNASSNISDALQFILLLQSESSGKQNEQVLEANILKPCDRLAAGTARTAKIVPTLMRVLCNAQICFKSRIPGGLMLRFQSPEILPCISVRTVQLATPSRQGITPNQGIWVDALDAWFMLCKSRAQEVCTRRAFGKDRAPFRLARGSKLHGFSLQPDNCLSDTLFFKLLATLLLGLRGGCCFSTSSCLLGVYMPPLLPRTQGPLPN